MVLIICSVCQKSSGWKSLGQDKVALNSFADQNLVGEKSSRFYLKVMVWQFREIIALNQMVSYIWEIDCKMRLLLTTVGKIDLLPLDECDQHKNQEEKNLLFRHFDQEWNAKRKKTWLQFEMKTLNLIASQTEAYTNYICRNQKDGKQWKWMRLKVKVCSFIRANSKKTRRCPAQTYSSRSASAVSPRPYLVSFFAFFLETPRFI